MMKQTPEEIVGRLKDSDVLDIIREVMELEGILYKRAKAEGLDLSSKDSPYALFFGKVLEDYGPEVLSGLLKMIRPEDGRHVLVKFLEFNYCLAKVQVEEPEREIFCASLNVSEVLRAGMGVVSKKF